MSAMVSVTLPSVTSMAPFRQFRTSLETRPSSLSSGSYSVSTTCTSSPTETPSHCLPNRTKSSTSAV